MEDKRPFNEAPTARRLMETYGPAERGAAWRLGLSAVSGLALVASTFTPWGFNHKAYRIGADVLFTKDATVRAGFLTSIGLLTLALGIVALAGLIPRRGWLTTVAGIAGAVIAIEFLITHLIRANFPRSQLDYGWYLALLSFLAIPAGFVGTRPKSSRPRTVSSGISFPSGRSTREAPSG